MIEKKIMFLTNINEFERMMLISKLNNLEIEILNKKEIRIKSFLKVEKKEEFYLKDKNNNLFSLKSDYEMEEIILSINTFMKNKNCENCIDCFDCEDCKDCIECLECKDCIECYSSISCKDCFNCENCNECIECINSSYIKESKNVKSSKYCENCKDCENIHNSEKLINCKDCMFCVDCENCNNLELKKSKKNLSNSSGFMKI